ncbi:putative RNA-binding protein 18 isoform X3 [Hippocampus comes]|uniref:Probable RNA-binding protein 18 n=1 Tax=Hippocampus comes TaxID=109280 RepID=A0A3Q3DRA4_HIPCM|nr:PREDICTED: probable RNA-binding protein 18 isoform X3 [Hippocampus comes]
MSSAAETMENASIISDSGAHDGNRLWIGNIDPKITEYHLVKLLEKFGHVKQFDFLFHKSGPLEGQPRGYCFVNFNTREEAERAIQCLNGKLALSKKLVVRWAHAQVRGSFTQRSSYNRHRVAPCSQVLRCTRHRVLDERRSIWYGSDSTSEEKNFLCLYTRPAAKNVVSRITSTSAEGCVRLNFGNPKHVS